MKRLFLLLICTGLTACEAHRTGDRLDSDQAVEMEKASALIGTGWPASQVDIATTDGDIFLDNLNSQISVIQGNPRLSGRTEFQVTLAALHYQRFQLEGRLEDANRSLAVLKTAETFNRFRPGDRLLYAQVLMGFHDFDSARKQISEAEKIIGITAETTGLRFSIERALQLPGRSEIEAPVPDKNYVGEVQQAADLINRGQLAEASRRLKNAQDNFGDSSPYPIAWIHVQQGIGFLRNHQYELAKEFFAAAHLRLPQYFLATEHLAETEGILGNDERSAELYRLVSTQTDQPAFWHGLAQAEARLGNSQMAIELAQRAAEGYANLLKEHPLMYADHAVGYYLDIDNVDQALALARQNFAHRKDLIARLALAEALLADKQTAAACEQVQAILGAGLSPPEITLPDEPLYLCSR